MGQSDSALSWIVREELREAFGIHYSDKRSSRSQLEARWQSVNFGDLSEEDEAWKSDKRETIENVEYRVDHFLKWLSWNQLVSADKSTGTNANVESCATLAVSHGVWMECLLRKYCPSIMEGGTRRVHNCDIVRVVLRGQWNLIGENWNCKRLELQSPSFINDTH